MLLGVGLPLGYDLDIWAGDEFPIMFLTLESALVAYIYSAPLFKLK